MNLDELKEKRSQLQAGLARLVVQQRAVDERLTQAQRDKALTQQSIQEYQTNLDRVEAEISEASLTAFLPPTATPQTPDMDTWDLNFDTLSPYEQQLQQKATLKMQQRSSKSWSPSPLPVDAKSIAWPPTGPPPGTHLADHYHHQTLKSAPHAQQSAQQSSKRPRTGSLSDTSARKTARSTESPIYRSPQPQSQPHLQPHRTMAKGASASRKAGSTSAGAGPRSLSCNHRLCREAHQLYRQAKNTRQWNRTFPCVRCDQWMPQPGQSLNLFISACYFLNGESLNRFFLQPPTLSVRRALDEYAKTITDDFADGNCLQEVMPKQALRNVILRAEAITDTSFRLFPFIGDPIECTLSDDAPPAPSSSQPVYGICSLTAVQLILGVGICNVCIRSPTYCM